MSRFRYVWLRGGIVVSAILLLSGSFIPVHAIDVPAASAEQFVEQEVIDNPAIESDAAVEIESLSTDAAAFLPLINEFRAKNGVGPLKVSAALTTSAEWMSDDMATKNRFNHTDSLGRNMKTRLNSFGIQGTMGENIAAGQATAADVFKAWENSPGHRANMLNSQFTMIGIGLATSSTSEYKTYWTTDFSNGKTTAIDPKSSSQTPHQSSYCTRHPDRRICQKGSISSNITGWLFGLFGA